jgi:predicted PurR-regulated permease PerM
MQPDSLAGDRDWRATLRRPATAQWTIALVALLAALWAGRTFAVTVVVSVTLAVLLWPVAHRVERVLRSRALAAMLVVAVTAAGTLGLSFAVATQVSAAAQRSPDVLRLAARDVASLGSAGAATVQRTRHALRELDRSVARVTGTPAGGAQADAKARSLVSEAVEAVIRWLAGAMRYAADLLLQAGVIAMLTFFLLCSGERLAARLSAWCDDRPRVGGRVAPLLADLAHRMRQYGWVTLATNAAIALTVALVLWPFGVAQPWLWGALAGALHFVPYAGLAVLMLLAASEVYVLHASWAAAALAVLLIAGIGFVVGTGMAAWLHGRASRVDGAIVFTGTVFFSVLWGAWGLVLGPLLVVALRVVALHARQLSPAPADTAATRPVPDRQRPSSPDQAPLAGDLGRHGSAP